MTNVPDNYYIRIFFEFTKQKEYADDIINFINQLSRNTFCDHKVYKILCKIGLKNKNYNNIDTGICGCVEYECKYVSKPYISIEDNKIWFKFSNTKDDKWTFEELNGFIKEFTDLVESDGSDFLIEKAKIELTFE